MCGFLARHDSGTVMYVYLGSLSMSEPAIGSVRQANGFVRCRATGHCHCDGIRYACGQGGIDEEDRQQ